MGVIWFIFCYKSLPMKQILIKSYFLLSILFFFNSAFAMIGSRTCFCALMNCQLSTQTQEANDIQYSLSKIKDLKSTLTNGTDFSKRSEKPVYFSYPQEMKFLNSEKSKNLKLVQQMNSVERFLMNSQKDNSKKDTRVLVIRGRAEIQKFVQELQDSNQKIALSFYKNESVELAKAYASSLAFSLLMPRYTWAANLAEAKSLAYWFAFGTGIFLYNEYDSKLGRFVNSVIKNLDSKQDAWGYYSNSAYLNENVEATNLHHEDKTSVQLVNEQMRESYLMSFFKRVVGKSIWVGVDLLMLQQGPSEPELHVILRKSKKRPQTESAQ